MTDEKQDRAAGIPAGLADQLDARGAEYMALLEPRQEAYLAQYGNYWQGLLSHVVDPDQTAFDPQAGEEERKLIDVPPDNMHAKPDDVEGDWYDMLPEIENGIPFAIRVDVIEGVEGHGYIVYAFVRHAGEIYRRLVPRGNAPAEEPWTVFVPAEDPATRGQDATN
jgi:hypothetical protein